MTGKSPYLADRLNHAARHKPNYVLVESSTRLMSPSATDGRRGRVRRHVPKATCVKSVSNCLSLSLARTLIGVHAHRRCMRSPLCLKKRSRGTNVPRARFRVTLSLATFTSATCVLVPAHRGYPEKCLVSRRGSAHRRRLVRTR